MPPRCQQTKFVPNPSIQLHINTKNTPPIIPPKIPTLSIQNQRAPFEHRTHHRSILVALIKTRSVAQPT